jgi:hypothetical protein
MQPKEYSLRRCRRWRVISSTDYDWRKCEAKLQSLPNFLTEIDGLDIHFIHVRSKHENALPLIVTHGWPGSIVYLIDATDLNEAIEVASQIAPARVGAIEVRPVRELMSTRWRTEAGVGSEPVC